MGQKKIGVALVGCGNIGQIHAATLANLAADGLPLRPVIAADPVPENLENIASNWPFERLVSDAKEVLSNPEVDAIFIATPTFTRRELVLAALAAQKHLYAEKPLAPDFETVKEICRAAMASPVIAQVGFQMRCNAMHARVKKFIESNELGRPVCYQIRNDECWPTTAYMSYSTDWRSQRKFSGGGPLIEHSIHSFDLANWMFGPAKRVAASTRSVFGFDVEDAAAVSLEHESGVIGTLMTIYGGVEGREESRLEVFFEKGIVEITWGVLVDGEENRFRLQRSGEPAQFISLDELLQEQLFELGIRARPFFWNELASRNFFKSIQTGAKASPGFGDGLLAHAVVEAAYRSATQKKAVELSELLT